MPKVTIAPKTIGAVAVPVPGTIVPLSATPLEVSAVVVQAKKTNAGVIYLGDATLVAPNGIQLAAGEYFTVTADTEEDDTTNCVLDLQSVFIDASIAGDEVVITSLEETNYKY